MGNLWLLPFLFFGIIVAVGVCVWGKAEGGACSVAVESNTGGEDESVVSKIYSLRMCG